MESILIIGSILGIINSCILIVYPPISTKGAQGANVLFTALMLAVALMLLKPLLSTLLGTESSGFLFPLHLFGLIAIGPISYLFIRTVVSEKNNLPAKALWHLTPAILLIALWFLMQCIPTNYLHTNYKIWNIYHRIIMLLFVGYITAGIFCANKPKSVAPNIRQQLNIINASLLVIWFAALLHEVAGLNYVEETAMYGFSLYLTIRIVINKGYIVEPASGKYKKTGLKEEEKARILKALQSLLKEQKVYRDNTISAAKLAKRTGTGVHALSQVINEHYHFSLFELISNHRIREAKRLLKDEPETKISDIAFDVGYNSLSAFNTAFKKQTGKTPSEFRKKHTGKTTTRSENNHPNPNPNPNE